ncbi:hypothetical protein U732_3938 [Clostridium argentinense CDC 2741]|uniref:Uncharacterized protein n=1 Tax=Clostridium argentinense CDC 2741 TaxID=1418104 RepID=A0A0C1U8Q5_9CLOT|nr:hypothetical protein [Clostridium argentinense]ARC85065.1 hypothetical protein RSJ17_11435 [Clostridium argentinense]KIE48098.1 hypothetical protein U732_3938 [Clostridium argentinense CDC 2741]NFF40399.1 hypothetical protein [Clostridium argentinense]NFP50474.1 hypothetical protein [Clostridium argentinense]NFP74823.1 hypothetical protein [Clostridium argentinense]
MSKICIFDENKNCSNCNECNLCELNNNRACDNCGKCLQLEGYDVKAIKIDEVFEDKKQNTTFKNYNEKINIEDFSDFDLEEDSEDNYDDSLEEVSSGYIDALDDENNWSYLEDIDKIKELLENGEDISSLGSEVFPGLISLKNPKNN